MPVTEVELSVEVMIWVLPMGWRRHKGVGQPKRAWRLPLRGLDTLIKRLLYLAPKESTLPLLSNGELPSNRCC